MFLMALLGLTLNPKRKPFKGCREILWGSSVVGFRVLGKVQEKEYPKP